MTLFASTKSPELPLVRVLIVIVAASAVLAAGLTPPALAQEVRQKKSLLELFFGKREPQQTEVIQLPSRKKPKKAKKRSKRASVAAIKTPGEQPPAAKNPDARHVLVIGDFMASGLAEGLEKAFKDDPAILIDSRTNMASGLVRDDHHDWPQEFSAAIGALKPAVVLVMLGSNDRQQMAIDRTKEKFDSPAWNKAYTARVSAMLKVAADRRLPLVWVGLPAFRNAQTSSAALQLNSVYRNEAARAGAEFVDIWDGFVDENGKFVLSGSDINGQPVRLRTADGVGMTTAGKRKMAFYAEKPLRKILGEPLVTGKPESPESEPRPQETVVKAGPPVRTPPIGLTDPALDGGDTLLGGAGTAAAGSVFPALPQKTPAGRVDDFAYPAL